MGFSHDHRRRAAASSAAERMDAAGGAAWIQRRVHRGHSRAPAAFHGEHAHADAAADEAEGSEDVCERHAAVGRGAGGEPDRGGCDCSGGSQDGLFESAVRQEFSAMAQEAMEPTWLTLLLRGIFAGWLIALLVWMLPYSESSHFFVIILITWLIGVAKFSHIIAGAVEVFAAGMVWRKSMGNHIWRLHRSGFAG